MFQNSSINYNIPISIEYDASNNDTLFELDKISQAFCGPDTKTFFAEESLLEMDPDTLFLTADNSLLLNTNADPTTKLAYNGIGRTSPRHFSPNTTDLMISMPGIQLPIPGHMQMLDYNGIGGTSPSSLLNYITIMTTLPVEVYQSKIALGQGIIDCPLSNTEFQDENQILIDNNCLKYLNNKQHIVKTSKVLDLEVNENSSMEADDYEMASETFDIPVNLSKQDCLNNIYVDKSFLNDSLFQLSHFKFSSITMDFSVVYPTTSESSFNVQFDPLVDNFSFENVLKQNLYFVHEFPADFEDNLSFFVNYNCSKFAFHPYYLTIRCMEYQKLIWKIEQLASLVHPGDIEKLNNYIQERLQKSEEYRKKLEEGFRWMFYLQRMDELCDAEINEGIYGSSYLSIFYQIQKIFLDLDCDINIKINALEKVTRELTCLKDLLEISSVQVVV
ncbi:uncharacterized protein SAPINGB_P005325 [Magnusiomyces paraingens]|uniref:Uncharacterized protein n=1 Tax=Magnusiomyces paraingens TaxID=2606893 RepID=A0A5E8C4S7_9ASCO|nr:uncharacterized protein SAPINGB_P005325 [Saprochaete ingens]VVT56838.1 unnamed protein product [Saprochaete ingens]